MKVHIHGRPLYRDEHINFESKGKVCFFLFLLVEMRYQIKFLEKIIKAFTFFHCLIDITVIGSK